MPSPRRTGPGSIIVMASLAALLAAQGLARGQDALPGSMVSLWRAKQEARFIVSAEVVRTANVLRAGGEAAMGYILWTELKLSAVLKGEIDEGELNRRPLWIEIRANERIPKAGEEVFVFVGDARSNAPITKMLWKTEENLAAIEAAKPEPRPSAAELRPHGIGGGLGGGGSGSGDLNGETFNDGSIRTDAPVKPATLPAHVVSVGMSIAPDKKAEGAELVVQEAFAAAMARVEPKSKEREDHFAWLDRNDFARHYAVQRAGWYGRIQACDPRPGGGWLIKAALSPRLHPGFGMRFCFVTDTVERRMSSSTAGSA